MFRLEIGRDNEYWLIVIILEMIFSLFDQIIEIMIVFCECMTGLAGEIRNRADFISFLLVHVNNRIFCYRTFISFYTFLTKKNYCNLSKKYKYSIKKFDMECLFIYLANK